MNKIIALLVVVSLIGIVGCSRPYKRVQDMRLGMTPVEVRDVMGKPHTIRAAKVFQDGQSTEIWEYQPGMFEINPKGFWVHFENARVVQWGEPGDFGGKATSVEEYKPFKKQQ